MIPVSDDAHERPSKKDLLIGKRKDKKDNKKDLRYATLEGESSPEEDSDLKYCIYFVFVSKLFGLICKLLLLTLY